MITIRRRDFTFAAALLFATFGVARRQPTFAPKFQVLIDTRFAEARFFGEHAEILGANVRSLEKGSHSSWLYEQMQTRSSAPPVVGLTSERTLFGLDLMLRHAHRRVVYRTFHRKTLAGVNHQHPGGVRSVMVAAQQLPTHHGWGAHAAQLAIRCSAVCSEAVPLSLGTALDDANDMLVSWVIGTV